MNLSVIGIQVFGSLHPIGAIVKTKQVQQHMLVIPAFGRPRQEDFEFKASWGIW
jgi:hypothetical protein